MSRRQAIEAALASWRDAERRLELATDGDRDAIAAEVERHRTEFQRMTTDHMIERMDALKDAEDRRAAATPSSEPYREAARDEKDIASEIWDEATLADEGAPG